MLTSSITDQLTLKANLIRQHIVTMLAQAGSGHSAGALGLADVFAYLYFHQLKHRPTEPLWSGRDYLLLSNGHTCPVLYATLAEAGYFDVAELSTLRQLNSRLQGHPHLGSLPGVENTSGPLAQGLSQACGLALALRLGEKPNHVYCVMSDAEYQEGQVWEAYMTAAKYGLSNLTVMVDRNNIQIGGQTNDVMPVEPFADKLRAFGWDVHECDGHDFSALDTAINQPRAQALPRVVICRTIAGKGVSLMENNFEWHGKPPTPDQAETALAELTKERP